MCVMRIRTNLKVLSCVAHTSIEGFCFFQFQFSFPRYVLLHTLCLYCGRVHGNTKAIFSLQLHIHANSVAMQEPASLMQVDPNATSIVVVKDDPQNGGFQQAESIIHYSKVVPKTRFSDF